MDIQKVTIRLSATINMGQYENLQPTIEIEADMNEFELKTGKMVELFENARKDIAVSLMDMAEQDLKELKIHNIEPERRVQLAFSRSTAFEWMLKLHRASALDLLAEVVEELEAKPEPEMTETGTVGEYVIDLSHHTDEIEGDIQ